MREMLMPVAPILLPVKPNLNYWHDPGLKSCYPGSGTSCYDLSGSGYNGTLVGSPTLSTDVGGCFDLSGSAQYIDTNSNAILAGATAFTVHLWIKPDTTASYRPLFVSWINATYAQVMLRILSGNLELYIYNGGQYGGPTGAFTTTSAWSHITAVKTSSLMKTYVNGVQSATTYTAPAGVPSSSGAETYRIGKYGSYYFDGKIAGVNSYRRALSDTEILYNYTREKTRYGL